MTRVIIAGGRDFSDYDLLVKSFFEFLHSIGIYSKNVVEIVSGMAKGADSLGVRFAEELKIPLNKYPADWAAHGAGAGYARNKLMAENAEALLAFWDGKSKGTRHMIDMANKLGLHVCVIPYGGDSL